MRSALRPKLWLVEYGLHFKSLRTQCSKDGEQSSAVCAVCESAGGGVLARAGQEETGEVQA